MDYIFEEGTSRAIQKIASSLPQSLLISGPRGCGLTTVSKYLAKERLEGFILPINSKGELDTETGTISVSSIRSLYDQSRAKTQTKRVFVIDDAHLMSLGAQAAFLKLLEEPPENVHLILVTHSPERLLPTIRSRVQKLKIKKISKEQSMSLLESKGVRDATMKRQLLYLANGLPAELTRLIDDQKYFHGRAELVLDTKTLVTGGSYEKLLIISRYQNDRKQALALINSALLVLYTGVSHTADSDTVQRLELLLKIKHRIELNGNVKLNLMAFVV